MAGEERDRLLRLAAELDTELDCASAACEEQWAQAAGVLGPRSAWSFEQMHILKKEDEQLVLAFREALARVAGGVWRDRGADLAEAGELVPSAILAGLDGAEFVMRGEILTDGIGRLWDLLPSFVYLVTVPIVGQEEALAYSMRTMKLLAAARDGAM